MENVFIPLHVGNSGDFDRDGLFPIVTHLDSAASAATVGYAKDPRHARLFAAAPRMLDLLTDAIQYLEDGPSGAYAETVAFCDELRGIISQVRGR